jgi:hypothetical protein
MQTEIYSGRSGRRVAETQSDAFHTLTNRQLSESHNRIMALFTSSDVLMTRDEIAGRANMPVPTVCGRARELLDANRLQVRGTRKESGKRSRQQLLGLPEAQ